MDDIIKPSAGGHRGLSHESFPLGLNTLAVTTDGAPNDFPEGRGRHNPRAEYAADVQNG